MYVVVAMGRPRSESGKKMPGALDFKHLGMARRVVAPPSPRNSHQQVRDRQQARSRGQNARPTQMG